jgi:hypothetical protein
MGNIWSMRSNIEYPLKNLPLKRDIAKPAQVVTSIQVITTETVTTRLFTIFRPNPVFVKTIIKLSKLNSSNEWGSKFEDVMEISGRFKAVPNIEMNGRLTR